jgi:hypothetical protein
VDELEDEIAELASHIYAGTCRWLELIAELDRRGDFTESGSGSCAEWLAWRCGLMPRAAREHVRVARRLSELPLIHSAFSRGEISYSKVRALTRVADEESERELLELARHLTAAQLDRAVRCYRRVTNAEANDLQANAHLGWCWDEDGSFVLHARLAPEDGALFLRALQAGRDTLWEREWKEEAGSAEPRPAFRPTNADALVAMAETALSAPAGRSAGERGQVVVQVDAAALAFGDEGGCALEDGPALAPETARRLACDASVLNQGRKKRTVPPLLRRALRSRDRGCRFPGCENHRFVDAHHIRHWARGGETTLSNLVLLCRRHHRWVYEGGYSAEALSDGSVGFRDPWGGAIPDVPRSPPGELERLLEDNRELEIAAGSYYPGYNDLMDLDLTVQALTQITRTH